MDLLSAPLAGDSCVPIKEGLVLKQDIETQVRAWMIEVMKRKGLRPYEVAWAFPWQQNPKTVERWVYGQRPQLPSLEAFVGFCLVVRELPPVLRELCPDEIETPG